uniref:Uncharacterized protein n=1 Tax=Arachis ipaensis TaxID=130454 RepID=N1NKI6_ARAIP|nr:hypothetical protein ARAX_AIPA147A20-011 [Arachis ipaensis]
MALKSAATKNLQTAKKSAVARNLQLQEAGGVALPSKSDSGASASVKITPDPGLRLISSTLEKLVPPPSKQVNHPSPSNPEPASKKRKTSSSAIYKQGFDALVWSKKHIFLHSIISMDDVTIKSHLQVMARGKV